MTIRKVLAPTIIVCLLVCGLSFYVWAEDGDETEYALELGVGYHWTDYDDYPGKVGEYRLFDHQSTGPDMKISGNAQNMDLDLDFSARYLDDDDYAGRISGDYRRIFDVDFSYSSFEHWLDHDDMDNLCGRTGGVVVNHEDFNAGKDYIIRRTEQESDTTFNLPFSSGTRVNFNYHRQTRQGHRQAMTISHCGACHVTSHAREVNEETEDITAGVSKQFTWLTLVYEYFHREFDERGDAPLNTYDNPLHPGGVLGEVFDDRIQYGDETLPYDLVPSLQKDTHRARLHARLPGKSTFFASYLFTNTENNDSDLETDSHTVNAKLTNNFFPGLNLSTRFRYMNIDNDDVFVDVTEPVSVAGPNAGYTWADPNPDTTLVDYNSFDPDFLRLSALSREVLGAGLDVRYQLLKKTSLNLGYEWEQVDRDDFAVEDDGDTETTTNTVKLGIMSRPWRSVKLRLGYKVADTDNPFNYLNGACEGAFEVNAGNPWNSTQYWERQARRYADLSNQPTLSQEISGAMTWSGLRNFSVTANYRYIEEENDQTDVSDWEQQSHVPSLSLAYMPVPQLSFSLSYIYDWSETETLANIPVFNG